MEISLTPATMLHHHIYMLTKILVWLVMFNTEIF